MTHNLPIICCPHHPVVQTVTTSSLLPRWRTSSLTPEIKLRTPQCPTCINSWDGQEKGGIILDNEHSFDPQIPAKALCKTRASSLQPHFLLLLYRNITELPSAISPFSSSPIATASIIIGLSPVCCSEHWPWHKTGVIISTCAEKVCSPSVFHVLCTVGIFGLIWISFLNRRWVCFEKKITLIGYSV